MMTAELFISVLLSLLGGAALVTGILFWRMFTRMENKLDKFADHCEKCKEGLVKTKDFEDWQKGRDPLWKRLNRHGHDPKTGKVVITEG